MTAEQQARDLLDRMGVEGAQQMTAGDVGELAALIEETRVTGLRRPKAVAGPVDPPVRPLWPKRDDDD